jgi:hypothetical protein
MAKNTATETKSKTAEKPAATKKKKPAAKSDAAVEGKKPAPKKATRSRKKEPVEIRYKAMWGIYNQSLKRVAMFEYHDHKAAEKKREALSKLGKFPHFIQKDKEVIEEEV